MRRRLTLAAITAAFVLALFPHAQVPAVAALRASGRIVARQVDHSMPAFTVGEVRRQSGERIDAADAGSTGGETLSVTSPAIDAGQLFERVGVHYRAARGAEDAILVEVRASPDGRTWGEWQLFHPEEDLADEATNTWYIAPQVVPQTSRFAQYRAWLTSGMPTDLEHLALTFLDVNDLNAPAIARLASDLGGALADMARSFLGSENGYAMAAPTGAPKVLTRQDWGADERLMKWTPKYEPWKKAVIHHTVTSDGGTNVAAEIRSIYYFHAVTRGWGDIGYNYLVDKFGNVWIGRQGGDHVVGGHAYGWNDGTFGIAAIGDYSVVAPTSSLQGALSNLIATRFKQLGIAPYGNGSFTHEEQRTDGSWIPVTTTVPNVLGHRDCTYVVGKSGGQTACPGGKLYAMMDGLRRLAQTAWQNGYTYMTKIEPRLPSGGFPGQKINVPVLVTNLGTVAIPAGTTVAYRVLRNGAAIAQGTGVQIAQPIASGATASVTVPFTAPSAGTAIVRWDLQSGSAWWSTVYNTPFRDQWFRSADWSADWISDNVLRSWTAGETKIVTVTVQNDGGRTWNAAGTNPVKLGYYWISTATGNRFEGQARQALPRDVAPGQTVTLTMPVVAPVYPTNYTLVLDLRKENEFWFRDKGLRPDDTPVTVSTDFSATYEIGTLPKLESNKTVAVPVTVTNTGNGTFPITSSYPVSLGYHWYDTAGKQVVWDGTRTKLPADLLSGKSVTFQAQVTAPDRGGTFSLRFDLVQEGVGWFSSKGVPTKNVTVTVAGPAVAVYGAAYQPGVSTLAQSGGLSAIPFTVTNTGNFTWSPSAIALSYHWANAAGATVQWEGLRTKLPQDVAPGESVTLQANVAFPTAQATYTLRWDMVHEGVSWFSGKGVRTFDQSVVVGPAPFYGGSLDVSRVPSTLPLQMTAAVPVAVQNMSSFDWDATVNLSYHWYDAGGNVVVWDGLRTPLAGMRPGEVRSVSARVFAPSTAGVYTLRFDVVQEGVTWFSSRGMQLAPIGVKVERPVYGAQYAPPATVSAKVGTFVVVPVSVTNVGSLTWQPNVVNLAYHLNTPSGNVYVWDGQRTPVSQPVATGQTLVVQALVRVPTTPGTYAIRWDLVQEGITWFSGQAVPTGRASLVVQ